MRRNLGVCFVVVSAMLLFFASMTYAGVYWESEVVKRGAPGQPDENRTERYYVTKSASRNERANGRIIIINFNRMTMYELNPKSHTYTETNLDSIRLPGMDQKTSEMAFGILGQGMMQVTPTNETKTIRGYQCRKFTFSFIVMQGEYWVSKDVKAYGQLKAIGQNLAKRLDKNPMLTHLNLLDVLNKSDGFPVQIVTQTMGRQTTSTLRKVEEKEFTDDLFSVPNGYTLKQSAHL